MSTQQISVRHRKDEESSSTIRLNWHDLAHRFIGERECLASYLALETAEVIGGAKPANLINLADWERPCGRNMFSLWRRHGKRLMAQSGLAATELVKRDNGVLLLIYQPESLETHLATPRVANFLRRAGYRRPEGLAAMLQELADRFAAGDFPHEIGAILGYPLKDVAGFMGWVRLPVTGQGPWKIYGDPRPSLDVVAACRSCRNHMAQRLIAGISPLECLRESGRSPFLLASN